MKRHNNSPEEMKGFLEVYNSLTSYPEKEDFAMRNIDDCDEMACEREDCDHNCPGCLCFFCGYCFCEANSTKMSLEDAVRLIETELE